MKKIFLSLSLLVISGCSTDVVSQGSAVQAPSSRIFKYQENDSGKSVLTVIRDSGMTGGGCLASVYIDGEKVASLKPKEKVSFYLIPGERAVGASFEGRGLCSFGSDRQERFIMIGNNDKKAVRIYTDSEANMDIRPTTM